MELLLQDKRSPATKRAYRADLLDFFGGDGGHGGAVPDPAAVAAFLQLSPPQVALRLAIYKADLMSRNMAEATVNRRLAAVRSLLKLSFRMGFASTDGRGLIDGEKTTAYRDTRGIDVKQVKKLLSLPDTATASGKRDRALLLLLFENALRRAEVCGLAVADFEPETRRLMIRGKGKGTQQQPVTISARSTGAITAYLLAAEHRDGPLFRNQRDGGGLTTDGLYKIVKGYGAQIGVKLAPHKLRHSSITAALDATGGDVRKVQRLSRHADVRTLTRYDDSRQDFQGEVTGLLSKLL